MVKAIQWKKNTRRVIISDVEAVSGHLLYLI